MNNLQSENPPMKTTLVEQNNYINYTLHNTYTDQNIPCVAKVDTYNYILNEKAKYRLCVEDGIINMQNAPLFTKSQLDKCYLTLEKRGDKSNFKTVNLGAKFTQGNNTGSNKGFSIEHFMDVFNIAMNECKPVGNDFDIFLQLNQADNAYNLCISEQLFDGTTTNDYDIRMNQQLYAYVGSGFQTYYERNPTNPNTEYKLIFSKKYAKGTFTTDVGAGSKLYYVFTQQFSTVTNLYYYDTILLQLNGIPIVYEMTGNFNSNSRTMNVLTSFTLNNVNMKSNLVINPVHYRYVNTLSSSILKSSSIQAYLRSVDGQIEELSLSPDMKMSIRLKLIEM